MVVEHGVDATQHAMPTEEVATLRERISHFQVEENMVIFDMANRLLPPVLTRRRIWMACAVALVADAIQLVLGPLGWAGLDEAIDVVVMLLLSVTIGFHPLFLPAFVAEFIPIVDMLPTWTGCALVVIGLRRRKQSTPPPAPPPMGNVIDV